MNPQKEGQFESTQPIVAAKTCGDCRHRKPEVNRCLRHSTEDMPITMYAHDVACAHFEQILATAAPNAERIMYADDQFRNALIQRIESRTKEINSDIDHESIEGGNAIKREFLRSALTELEALKTWVIATKLA